MPHYKLVDRFKKVFKERMMLSCRVYLKNKNLYLFKNGLGFFLSVARYEFFKDYMAWGIFCPQAMLKLATVKNLGKRVRKETFP